MNKNKILFLVFLSSFLPWVISCGSKTVSASKEVTNTPDSRIEEKENGNNKKKVFTIKSPDIFPGRLIPRKYTCQGSDKSPEIQWEEPPDNTKSFVFIMDDPDAPMGDWIHWIIYNIPPSIRHIEGSSFPNPKLPGNALYGKNSWKRLGYGGPCPPTGTHRYFFRLYALDKELELKEGATKEVLFEAIKENIIAKTEFFGLYNKD